MTTAKISVVGLGPAGPEYLTAETLDLLQGGEPVWLRTSRHPAAEGLNVAGSFDSLYETLDSFEEVYGAIVSELIELARTQGSLVYAVPGSPTVAEHTVELLRVGDAVTSGEVELDVRPAMGFTDLCWGALGIDPMAEAVTIVDALSLSVQGAGRIGPLLITQVHSGDVLEDVISILDDVAPEAVTVLQGLGTANELIQETPWSELRSAVTPDHLTTLWIPRLSETLGAAFARLDELVREQRAQTGSIEPEVAFAQLRSSFPDAAATVATAVDAVLAGDSDAHFDLEDALAQAMYQLAMHGRLAAEAGWFTIEDVANTSARQAGGDRV